MSQAAEWLKTQDDDHILRLHHPSGFNPLEFPICSQTPKRHNVPTAWTGHVPFAMGLVAMARPRVVVELGTQWGVSYCAFCQAVKALRLDARCYAVDTWRGDSHAGFYDDAILNNLKQHHDPEYALFSELIQATFDNARPRFQDGTIDILHIDGFHSYEAVKHDFETWLPKMSDCGVVLFHDNEIRYCESYGVWRLWDEIKQHYPHFEFYHWFGLGVLAVGKSIPAGLQPLLDAPKADADRIREYFTNLGEHLNELFSISLERSHLQAQLHAKAAECDQAQALLHAQADECAQARALLHAQADECAQARALLHAQADECARLADELAATRQHFGQFRFQAIDAMAHRIGRYPRLYRTLRSLARTANASGKR
jgi:predicted O-methyltransferase YrrM